MISVFLSLHMNNVFPYIANVMVLFAIFVLEASLLINLRIRIKINKKKSYFYISDNKVNAHMVVRRPLVNLEKKIQSICNLE